MYIYYYFYILYVYNMYIYIYLCVYIYVCMYVCMHACMHACMHVCMYVCICISTCWWIDEFFSVQFTIVWLTKLAGLFGETAQGTFPVTCLLVYNLHTTNPITSCVHQHC